MRLRLSAAFIEPTPENDRRIRDLVVKAAPAAARSS